ncbi:MAG: ATP12 family chaperone protein [Kiloniellales bacterium]
MVAGPSLKRFYKRAEVCGAEGGFGLELDARRFSTPAKAPFVVPSRALAEAIAAEWQAQGERIVPRSMPLTQLACTALDRVAPNRAEIAAELAAYGAHDLLCYRAERPESLAARQAALWQPHLDWAARALDAPLLVTAGVVSRPQRPKSLSALAGALQGFEPFALAALDLVVRGSGSLVLGLALAAGRIDAEAAFEAAELDASFQIERWGEDREDAARRTALAADLAAAERFLRLLQA